MTRMDTLRDTYATVAGCRLHLKGHRALMLCNLAHKWINVCNYSPVNSLALDLMVGLNNAVGPHADAFLHAASHYIEFAKWVSDSFKEEQRNLEEASLYRTYKVPSVHSLSSSSNDMRVPSPPSSPPSPVWAIDNGNCVVGTPVPLEDAPPSKIRRIFRVIPTLSGLEAEAEAALAGAARAEESGGSPEVQVCSMFAEGTSCVTCCKRVPLGHECEWCRGPGHA
jgi:hypothetical protein